MEIIAVLSETGWDFDTYLKQPQWVIDHILAKKIAQGKVTTFNQKYGRK